MYRKSDSLWRPARSEMAPGLGAGEKPVILTPMSRWFQFSLRALLVALTVFCLIFGWTIDRVGRRGDAIDAIVEAGSAVLYDRESDIDSFFEDSDYLDWWGKNPSHFWQDLKRTPVIVDYQGFALDASLARNIKAVIPISALHFRHAIRDDELRLLHGLSGPCELTLHDIENLSADALDEFRRQAPGVQVYRFQEGQLYPLDD